MLHAQEGSRPISSLSRSPFSSLCSSLTISFSGSLSILCSSLSHPMSSDTDNKQRLSLVCPAYTFIKDKASNRLSDLSWPLQDPVNALADGMSIKRLAGDILHSLPHGSLSLNEPLLNIAACSLRVEGSLQAQLLALLTQHCSHLSCAKTESEYVLQLTRCTATCIVSRLSHSMPCSSLEIVNIDSAASCIPARLTDRLGLVP